MSSFNIECVTQIVFNEAILKMGREGGGGVFEASHAFGGTWYSKVWGVLVIESVFLKIERRTD